ncbi:MAG: hypothetical protein IJ246_03115 [Clostridia bacterium]|nr:hypothetical protein [Clostridia bacterium]
MKPVTPVMPFVLKGKKNPPFGRSFRFISGSMTESLAAREAIQKSSSHILSWEGLFYKVDKKFFHVAPKVRPFSQKETENPKAVTVRMC